MIIFPAIDLKNGQVVRLVQGDMEQATLMETIQLLKLFSLRNREPNIYI